ncbi:MAG: S9 family peptidase [Firmicutes bacterium]|nr:S9 family peptidase [Bacillota bacterium]
MRKVTAEDLYQFKFVAAPQWSEDGKKAVFTLYAADEKSNGYKADAWLFEGGKLRRLTSTGDVRGAQWLDNDTLFYSGLREAEDKEAAKKGCLTVFYQLSLKGGEAQELVRIPLKASGLKALSCGKYAFLAAQDNNKDRDPGWEVFDEIPFWKNGEGYTSDTRKRLWVMDGGKLTAVTGEYEQVGAWAADGERLIFATKDYKNVMGMTSGVYTYVNGIRKTIIPDGLWNVHGLFFMDGKAMAVMSDMKDYGASQVPYFYCIEGAKPVQISTMEETPVTTVAGDSSFGGGAKMAVDDGWLYYTAVEDSWSVLRRLKDGRLETLLHAPVSIDAIAVKNGQVLVSSVTQQKLPELYCVENGEMKQLSFFNEEMTERAVQLPHPITAVSDGWKINGYVIYPAEYEEGKTYPAILDIHGGPHGAYGAQYFHEMQVWASAGYFVFFCNIRGGDGRGNEFADLRGQYGKIDYDDIMAFTEEVLRQFPQIDKERLGVTGGSYGGYMTNWIIGHTDLFHAAAAQRSISNWISKFLCTDNGYLYNQELLQGNPWDDTEKLWWHSPLKYAANAKTPTLFIQSDQDYRCWMAECIQMFSTLKLHGVDARICLFHGENHNLSREGKPKNRVRRINEITAWMDKYLK